MKTKNHQLEAEKDARRLGAIRDHYASFRVLPSYSQMQSILSFKSKQSVSSLISRLKLSGFLDQAPDKRLVPGKRFFERPIANSTVQAGAFTETYNEGTSYLTIDEHLVRRPSETELIPVKGDSMKDAGILDGDTVVVEKRAFANVGDIVVAIIDDRFTIKTLGRERGQYVLIPANKDFDVIRPKEMFAIFGIVVGQFRSY